MKCQTQTDRWVQGEEDEGEEQIINGVREAGGAVWGDCGHNEHLLFNGLLSRAEHCSGIHKNSQQQQHWFHLELWRGHTAHTTRQMEENETNNNFVACVSLWT